MQQIEEKLVTEYSFKAFKAGLNVKKKAQVLLEDCEGKYFPEEVNSQFRYLNIQLKTIDFSTKLRGINYRVCGVYSPEPRGDVYCFKLILRYRKLAYCFKRIFSLFTEQYQFHFSACHLPYKQFQSSQSNFSSQACDLGAIR